MTPWLPLIRRTDFGDRETGLSYEDDVIAADSVTVYAATPATAHTLTHGGIIEARELEILTVYDSRERVLAEGPTVN